MPDTKKLEPGEIQEYFDTFSRRFLRGDVTNLADVEVTSSGLGAQFEAEGAQLNGVTYDSDRNVLDIIFEAGDHRVFQPSEIWVLEEPDGFVRAIEVVLADGAIELIKVRRGAPAQPRLSREDAAEQRPYQ